MERPSWDASQRRPSISSQTSSTSLRWWWWWWWCSTLMLKIPDQEQIHFLRNDWGEPRRLHLSPRGTLITMGTIMMIFLTTNTPHILRPSSRRSLSSESYSSSDTSPEGVQLSYYNRLAPHFTNNFLTSKNSLQERNRKRSSLSIVEKLISSRFDSKNSPWAPFHANCIDAVQHPIIRDVPSCIVTVTPPKNLATSLDPGSLAGKWCPQGQTSSASSATTSRRLSRRRRRRRRRRKRRRSRWTPWVSSACRTSCSERLGRTRRTFWQSTHSWRGTTQAKQFEVGMVGAKTGCGGC